MPSWPGKSACCSAGLTLVRQLGCRVCDMIANIAPDATCKGGKLWLRFQEAARKLERGEEEYEEEEDLAC